MTDRIINRPDTPPIDWFQQPGDDYQPGQTLRVVTQGPDEGRAYGLIMPAAGESRFMNRGRHHGLPTPDAREFPDGLSHFNRGPIEALAPDGSLVTVQGGRLPIKGGHTSGRGKRLPDGIEWLHREGRHADRAADIGLFGVAHAVDIPAGAVLFCGVIRHGLTLAEAEEVNGTTFSCELWDHPDGYRVFAGATRVDFTAWPYPSPIAAGSDDCPDGVCIVGFGDDPRECAPETGQEPEQRACGGDCGACRCGDRTQPAPVALRADEPVTAEVDDAEFGELRAEIGDLVERLARIEELVADLTIGQAVEEFGLDQLVEGLAERVRSLETEVDNKPLPEGSEQADADRAGQTPPS